MDNNMSFTTNFFFLSILVFSLLGNSLQQSIFNIEDFGAKSGIPTKNQALANGHAFAKALGAANASSSATVLVPGGKTFSFLPGAVTFAGLNGVTVQIEGNLSAFTERFQENWPGYPDTYNFISFTNGSNLVITGSGSLIGNGYDWWDYVIVSGKDYRPDLLEITSSSSVAVTNIRLENAPQYHLNMRDVINSAITNITVYVDVDRQRQLLRKSGHLLKTKAGIEIPTFPLNTDGIDIAGQNVLISNVTIENFDDAVAVKPMHSRSNSRFNINCTSNITIVHAKVTYGVGMSIGSVPPNPGVNCIDGVKVQDVNFTTPLKAIYIKPNPGSDGSGLIANIFYQDINVYKPIWWAIFVGTQQQHQPKGVSTGCSFLYPLLNTSCPTNPAISLRNITLQRVNIENGLLSPGILIANVSNPATGFLFDQVTVKGGGQWPIDGGQYMCNFVKGVAVNSNPVPPCFETKRIAHLP